jgi:hypothetical protein
MDFDFQKAYQKAEVMIDMIENSKQILIQKVAEITSFLQANLKSSWRYLTNLSKSLKKLKYSNLSQLSSMSSEIKPLLNISSTEDLIFIDKVSIIQNIKSSFFKRNLQDIPYIVMIKGEDGTSPSLNFFYIDLTRQFSKIDPRCIKIEKFQHNEKIFAPSTLVIQMLKSNFFFFGGEKLSTGRSNIFNLKEFKVEKLDNLEAIHSCGGCFYKDEFVLIFGGLYGNNFSSESQKYSIRSKNWEKIQMLPESPSKTTASAVGDLIFITGTKSTGLYQYHFDSNYYSKPCSLSNLKILIREYAIGRLDGAKALYKIEGNSTRLLKKINFDIDYLNCGSFTAYGNFLFFISDAFELFRIDTENDEIQKICFLKLGRRQNTF